MRAQPMVSLIGAIRCLVLRGTRNDADRFVNETTLAGMTGILFVSELTDGMNVGGDDRPSIIVGLEGNYVGGSL